MWIGDWISDLHSQQWWSERHELCELVHCVTCSNLSVLYTSCPHSIHLLCWYLHSCLQGPVILRRACWDRHGVLLWISPGRNGVWACRLFRTTGNSPRQIKEGAHTTGVPLCVPRTFKVWGLPWLKISSSMLKILSYRQMAVTGWCHLKLQCSEFF